MFHKGPIKKIFCFILQVYTFNQFELFQEVLEKITQRNAEEKFVWIVLKEYNHLHGHKKCYNLKISEKNIWTTQTLK